MTMKLYYSPNACSLASHIVLRELDLPFELDRVHGGSKKTQDGSDFRQVNPLGYVPVLRLDDGELVTEGVAILQYLGDKKPESGLVPKAGTMDRVRMQEMLTFISSEVHKSFSPLFGKLSDETKQFYRDRLASRFEFLAKKLEGKKFLLGDHFTVADAYLFTVMRWGKATNVDISKWPVLQQYFDRVSERPAVKKAIEVENPPQ